MGSLRGLRDRETNLHLVYTPSGLANMFIEDELRETYGVKSREALVEVKTEKGYRDMMELMNLAPLVAEKWLFIVPESASLALKKKVVGLAEVSFGTSVILVRCKGWAEFKEILGKSRKCNDLYMSWMRKEDIWYLLRKAGVEDSVIDYVSRGYSNNVGSVFELYRGAMEGYRVENAAAVRALVGVGSGSLLDFVMVMMRGSVGERAVKNRVKVLKVLLEEYGCRKLKGYLFATVRDVLDLKVLWLNGVLYKRVENVPEGYDDTRLARVGRRFKDIKEIPLEDIVRLYLLLEKSGRWNSDLDALRFMYGYLLCRRIG